MLKLQNRLKKIKSYIRDNSAVYDVGTDHALIPAALVLEGHTGSITASDVAEGPIQRARENVLAYGVQDKIKICLADGLQGIELEERADVIIAGMGGDLIRDIIDRKPEILTGDKRLILQAMTKQELLNDYLAEKGFDIIDGGYVSDTENGKIYCVIVAEYSGEPYELTEVQRVLGAIPCEITAGDRLFPYAILHEIEVTEKKLKGKKLGEADFSDEESLVCELKRIHKAVCITNQNI